MMHKVTALRGFEWYPDGKTRTAVAAGQTIEVSAEQARLLADHGHIAAPTGGMRADDDE